MIILPNFKDIVRFVIMVQNVNCRIINDRWVFVQARFNARQSPEESFFFIIILFYYQWKEILLKHDNIFFNLMKWSQFMNIFKSISFPRDWCIWWNPWSFHYKNPCHHTAWCKTHNVRVSWIKTKQELYFISQVHKSLE